MNPKRNNTIDLLVTLYSDTVKGVRFFNVDLIEKGMHTPIIHMNLKSNYNTLQCMRILYRVIMTNRTTNITNVCVPGKHYVGKLQTIPRSMIKKPIPTSPIIYKYHQCNCYSSKCIQRVEPKFFRSF